MEFTKENIWHECERLRDQYKYSQNRLSLLVFPSKPSGTYNNRSNTKDGGFLIPISVLKFFGLTEIKLTHYKEVSPRIMEVIVNIKVDSIDNILMQLVHAVDILSYSVPSRKIPQTINKAIRDDKITQNISIPTFTRAFDSIGEVHMEFVYDGEDIYG